MLSGCFHALLFKMVREYNFERKFDSTRWEVSHAITIDGAVVCGRAIGWLFQPAGRCQHAVGVRDAGPCSLCVCVRGAVECGGAFSWCFQ